VNVVAVVFLCIAADFPFTEELEFKRAIIGQEYLNAKSSLSAESSKEFYFLKDGVWQEENLRVV